MADTRALLDRIAAFRRRLDQTPTLIPDGVPADEPPSAAALVAEPERLNRAVERLAPPAAEGQLPARLTARAHRLLVDARGLIAEQKKLADDPLLTALVRHSVGVPTAATDPLVRYHRGTVGLTESALRMVQAFPAGVEAQLRGCDGLESLLGVVRNRLGVLAHAVELRRNDRRRLDQLSGYLLAMHGGRAVGLDPFVNLAEEILDDARQAARIRWQAADLLDPDADSPTHAVARFVAAHALNVAQVMARLLPHDYEWAAKPVVPVVAALVMDVGMIAVPREILADPKELGPDDRRAIEAHAARSGDLVRRLLPETGPLADVIVAHHERVDGAGYPAGLRADDVPPLARFLAAADNYAARVADRPHRLGSDPRTALTDTMLAAEQGQLDRDFTEYLLHLSFHPVGTVVELVDGRTAVVAAVHTNKTNLRAASRPVVAVLTDADGRPLPRPEFVDLAAADRGGIVRALPAAERRQRLGEWYPDLC
jgi:hypothetical protein